MACEHNPKIDCPCTHPCNKHGNCCECIAYHNRVGHFPACFFSKQAEKTYDRSFAQLVKDRQLPSPC